MDAHRLLDVEREYRETIVSLEALMESVWEMYERGDDTALCDAAVAVFTRADKACAMLAGLLDPLAPAIEAARRQVQAEARP